MQAHLLCIFAVGAVLAAAASANLHIRDNHRTFINRLLFGRIWEYSEYCNDKRDAATTNRDDVDVQDFFDGSALRALDAPSDESIAKLTALSIKARASSACICSINSWGYAEESNYENSNSPASDQAICSMRINELVRSTHVPKMIQDKASVGVVGQNLTHASWDYLRAVDTFGRQPSLPLYYSHHLLGSYDECLVSLNKTTRYCIGAYEHSSWPAGVEFSGQRMALRVSLCLPYECSSDQLRQDSTIKQLDQLVKYNLPHLDTDKYALRDVFCPPTEDSPIRQWFAEPLSIVLALIALVWLLTLVIVNCGPQRFVDKSSLIGKSFAVRKYWHSLANSKHVDTQLAGLNGIKVLGMWWTMITHIIMITISNVHSSSAFNEHTRKSFFAGFAEMGQHSVPAFLIIAGFLAGYKPFKQSASNKPQQRESFGRSWLRMVAHRYLRLAPMYLVAYVYIRQFAHLLGKGPFWDYAVSEESEGRQCRVESWLLPILMLSNFVSPFSHCVLTGWHLANDLHSYFVLPFLLVVYRRSRALGNWLAAIAFVCTHLTHFYNFFMADSFNWSQIYAAPIAWGALNIIGRMAFDYSNPFGRIGTYFAGVILADVLVHSNMPHIGLALAAGCFMLHFAIGIINCDTGFWNLAGPYSKFIMYPSNRVTVEIAYVLILYAVLGFQKQKRLSSAARQTRPLTATTTTTTTTAADTQQRLLDAGQRQHEEHKSSNVERAPNNDTNNSRPDDVEHGDAEDVSKAAERMAVNGSTVVLELAAQSTRKAERSSCGPIVRYVIGLLSARAWNVLVKVNFTLMITHFTVLRTIIHSQRALIVFNWPNFIQLSALCFFASYLFALIIHLLVEMPLTSLMKPLSASLSSPSPRPRPPRIVSDIGNDNNNNNSELAKFQQQNNGLALQERT